MLSCLKRCVLQLFETKDAALQVRENQEKMAAALIGEALISASIVVLCDRVASAEFIDLFQQKKLDETLLMNLKTTLLILFAVLNDAEEKQIVNPAVREWLNELKHAVFDAEDLLDEIDTEALRCKLEGTDQIFSHVASLKSQGYENMFFLGKKLATCSELAIQSVMNLRSKAPVRKLVEVAIGMIDGEMDAISYCSLFSKFLLANARNGVF